MRAALVAGLLVYAVAVAFAGTRWLRAITSASAVMASVLAVSAPMLALLIIIYCPSAHLFL